MENHPVLEEIIGNKIFLIRGCKVMLDRDLAGLYGVETSALKRQVNRNIERFPEDFMFALNDKEVEAMVCQIGIPSKSYFGGATPYAFTEQGVAMLSSVLNSDRAVKVNIEIMRVFVKLNRYLSSHKELADKLNKLESKMSVHDEVIKDILEQIRRMITPPIKSIKRIGFYKESK